MCPDAELLKNPYRLYEISRHDPEGIHLLTVDRVSFQRILFDSCIRWSRPRAESAVDARRVRAIAIDSLETAANAGHSLQFASDLADTNLESAVHPRCPVTSDILAAAVPVLTPKLFQS